MVKKIKYIKIWVQTYTLFLEPIVYSRATWWCKHNLCKCSPYRKMATSMPIYSFPTQWPNYNIYTCVQLIYIDYLRCWQLSSFCQLKKLMIIVFFIPFVKKKPLIIVCFGCWKTANNCLCMRDRKPRVFIKFLCVSSNDLFLETLFTNENHQTLRIFLNVSSD